MRNKFDENIYHYRNLVETMFSVLKRKYREELRARKYRKQVKEVKFRFLIHIVAYQLLVTANFQNKVTQTNSFANYL